MPCWQRKKNTIYWPDWKQCSPKQWDALGWKERMRRKPLSEEQQNYGQRSELAWSPQHQRESAGSRRRKTGRNQYFKEKEGWMEGEVEGKSWKRNMKGENWLGQCKVVSVKHRKLRWCRVAAGQYKKWKRRKKVRLNFYMERQTYLKCDQKIDSAYKNQTPFPWTPALWWVSGLQWQWHHGFLKLVHWCTNPSNVSTWI